MENKNKNKNKILNSFRRMIIDENCKGWNYKRVDEVTLRYLVSSVY